MKPGSSQICSKNCPIALKFDRHLSSTAVNVPAVHVFMARIYQSTVLQTPPGVDVLITSSRIPSCCLHMVPINRCSLSLCKKYTAWVEDTWKENHKKNNIWIQPMKAFCCIFWNWEVRFTVVNLNHIIYNITAIMHDVYGKYWYILSNVLN